VIKNTLEDENVVFSWCEFQAQHAFIRDESSKDRYDFALSKTCFELLSELFFRKLYVVASPESIADPVHVC
jgi:hypothetical protein